MERGRTAWVAMGLVVATSVLVVFAAAVGGPWTMSNRSGIWGSQLPFDTSISPRLDQPSGYPSMPPQTNVRDLPAWLGPVFAVIGLVILVLIGVWVWRRYLADLFRGSHEVGAAAPGIPGEVYPDRPVVQQGLATALEILLATADPTDAVLAAWIHLEAAAGRSGVARKPSDTPSEFTGRVLTATPADHEAVETLLELYHRARFSPRGLGAADFNRARECLTRLAASWAEFDAPVDGAGLP